MKLINRNWIVLFAFALIPATMSHAWQLPQIPTGSTNKPTGSTSRPTGSTGKATGSTSKQQPEMSEEAKAFQQLQEQIRQNQDQIDFRFRTLPFGFPEKRKAYKAEIERLTAANEALKKEVFSKAKAAFKSSDQPSVQSEQIIRRRLVSMLSPQSEDDTFDPVAALELIKLLQEKDPNNARLIEAEFSANYAIERFENASKALDRLEKVFLSSKGPKFTAAARKISETKEELKETMEKYQQELMIRRLEANTDDLPRVLLVTTEGDIVVELFENHAPNTVANFIHLVRDQKFYDGKLFHLVKPGQYAASGSPTGNGMGNAGYRIPCECYDKKVIRSHFRGTLTMMTKSKDSGGSQFFITQQPNPHSWDGQHTAFGRVIDGMDVVMKLKNVDKTSSMASTTGVSKITRAEVIRARSHSYMPKKVEKMKGSMAGSGSRGSGSRDGSGSRNAATSDEDNTDTPSSFDLLLPKGSGSK